MTRQDEDTVMAALRASDRRRAGGATGASHDDAALERLHASILSRAEPMLRARRVVGRRRGLLDVAGAWSRAAVPFGVAASLVAGILLTRAQPLPVVEAVTMADATMDTPVTLFTAATGSVRATQLLESSVGSTSPEAVLYQAVPQ